MKNNILPINFSVFVVILVLVETVRLQRQVLGATLFTFNFITGKRIIRFAVVVVIVVIVLIRRYFYRCKN